MHRKYPHGKKIEPPSGVGSCNAIKSERNAKEGEKVGTQFGGELLEGFPGFNRGKGSHGKRCTRELELEAVRIPEQGYEGNWTPTPVSCSEQPED